MAYLSYPINNYPDTCATITLPSVLAEFCIRADETELDNESEVNMILLSEVDPDNPENPLYVPTDLTSLVAWNAAIDNAGDGIKQIYCIGDLPQPSGGNRRVSNNREIIGEKDFVLNVDIDDVNNTNYDASIALEGGHDMFMWYTTLGRKLYGSTATNMKGIRCKLLVNDILLASGNDSYEVLKWQFAWSHVHKPWRMESPF